VHHDEDPDTADTADSTMSQDLKVHHQDPRILLGGCLRGRGHVASDAVDPARISAAQPRVHVGSLLTRETEAGATRSDGTTLETMIAY